jgi:hypothetical protein
MIKLLNTTYPKDIVDEEDKKQWFLMRWVIVIISIQ